MDWVKRKFNRKKNSELEEVYFKDENNNFNFNKEIDLRTKENVEKILKDYGFTSLSFTDSRSYFLFYYLNNLEKDINIALKNGVKILNLSVELLTCKELAKEVFDLDVNNYMKNREPVKSNMKSKFYNLYNGKNGYLYNKKETIGFLKGVKRWN